MTTASINPRPMLDRLTRTTRGAGRWTCSTTATTTPRRTVLQHLVDSHPDDAGLGRRPRAAGPQLLPRGAARPGRSRRPASMLDARPGRRLRRAAAGPRARAVLAPRRGRRARAGSPTCWGRPPDGRLRAGAAVRDLPHARRRRGSTTPWGWSQLAEVEGLDLVSVQDHPYQARYLDTWTLLSVLGARTSTITLAPNVASLPLRPPVVLAKAAATLDLVTGGRVELGLGAGRVLGRHRRRRRPAPYARRGGRRARRGGRAGQGVLGRRDAAVRGRALPRRRAARRARRRARHPGLARRLQAADAAADRAAGRRLGAEHGVRRPAGRCPAMIARSSTRPPSRRAARRRRSRRIYNMFGRFGSRWRLPPGHARATGPSSSPELTLDVGMSTYVLGTDDADDVRRFADRGRAPLTRELVEAERGRRARGEAPRDPGPRPRRPTSRARRADRSPSGHRRRRTTARGSPAQLPWDESARPTPRRPAGAAYTGARQADRPAPRRHPRRAARRAGPGARRRSTRSAAATSTVGAGPLGRSTR